MKVLRSGEWWKNADGEVTSPAPLESKGAQFARAFAQQHGARFGIACTNGSAALEIALKALGVGPGDEVIVPPYTFIASSTAPLNIGAVPIFCDIEQDTFNLCPQRLEEAISNRTRAIMPVHFAGAAADMEAILCTAKRNGLPVLEDAAHGHGGSWNGKGLGSLGIAGTFSFQASKNMTAGEGGVITTSDENLALTCESYVWGGRVVGRPWYEHHRLGWNYRLTEMQAAILLEQLRRLEDQTARRMENGYLLNRQLGQFGGLSPLRVPDFVTSHPFHIYILRLDEREFGISRQAFLEALACEGIPCSAGYAHPLYKNPLFLNGDFCAGPAQRHSANSTDYRCFEELCPNAEGACRSAIWIEQRVLLGKNEDMRDVVDAVAKIWDARAELA